MKVMAIDASTKSTGVAIFDNDNLITYSYPKYKNEWRVHATVDGNLYDYETGRNYYALFWEGIDNNIYDMNEGFIVAGKDTVKFLEDKLSILGLNDKEINEFIVYWLPKMEDNKYNTLQEQISKIDEFIKVQTEQFGEEFEDEVNYLAIVKTNLEEVKK